MKQLCIFASFLLFPHLLLSQVGIGVKTPDPSAQLDITSNNKGLLIPRMNSLQRKSIIQPATGLIVFQTDGTAGFYYYSGTDWKFIVPQQTSNGLTETNAVAATVSSVTGTTNRITSTGGSTPKIDIASNYTGQNSITTLGTITTGLWNATVIPSNKGGAGNINGLLKANGLGIVSAAQAGIDFLKPTSTIIASTKTKISFDSQGLVTGGTDASTSDIKEGSNLYFTETRALNTLLNGLTTGSNTEISATDAVLNAFGKLQAQINNRALLLPKLSQQQRSALLNPGDGFQVYQTDNQSGIWIYTLGKWVYQGQENGTAKGDMQYWDGQKWVVIGAGKQGQPLVFCDGIPTWGGCSPVLSTNAPSEVTNNSALFTGIISEDGGTPVLEKGFVWSLLTSPTLENAYKISAGNGVGTMSIQVTGLSNATTYYVRSYALKSTGSFYGNEVNFTTAPADVLTGLLAYFPFTGAVADSSGNNLSITTNGLTPTTDRFGNENAALWFDHASNSFISGSSNSFPSGNAARTISLWYNAQNLGTGLITQLLGYGGNNCGQSFLVNFENTDIGIGKYEVQGHCLAFRNYANIPLPNNNTWHHIAISYDGTVIRFYNDGKLVSTSSATSLDTYVAGKIFCIGRSVRVDGSTPYYDPNFLGFTGKLDDIRIYSRALTADEINYLAHQ